MSESTINVDIELLNRHPELPGADQILERFAEHHTQSEARRRAHEELMSSDSNLDLEDFGSLAASALGSKDSHESVLGEETASFSEETFNDGDTLPEQEAVSEVQDATEETVDLQDDSETPGENLNESDDAPTEADEPQPEETAKVEETKQAEASSSKKRTRKRKKKKK